MGLHNFLCEDRIIIKPLKNIKSNFLNPSKYPLYIYRKNCIFCLWFRFWSPFKIIDKFCPPILSNQQFWLPILELDVACYKGILTVTWMSNSWKMKCIVVIIGQSEHDTWQSSSNKNVIRDSHHPIRTWHVVVNIPV